MKRTFLGLLIVGLLASPVSAASWQYLATDSPQHWHLYIDRASLKQQGKSTYRIWTKWVLNPDAQTLREEARERIKAKWSGLLDESVVSRVNVLTHQMSLYEVDLPQGRIRMLQSSFYDVYGHTIPEADLREPSSWQYPLPETMVEAIVVKVQELVRSQKKR